VPVGWPLLCGQGAGNDATAAANCNGACTTAGYTAGKYCINHLLNKALCHCQPTSVFRSTCAFMQIMLRADVSAVTCWGDPHCTTADQFNVDPQHDQPYIALQSVTLAY
jgi:hypothetical protein